jgi:hypothetical protein
MTGHRSFNDLRNRMSPERRARSDEATTVMLQEMALHELRQAREKTQQDVARALHVKQPAVAKLDSMPTSMSAICDAISRPLAARWRSRRGFPTPPSASRISANSRPRNSVALNGSEPAATCKRSPAYKRIRTMDP